METGVKPRAPGKAVRMGRPPKDLAAEVDERILAAARDLFLARGLAGVSVEEIARRARASKGTIYARFPTKEALFAAIAMRNAAKVQEGYGSEAPPGDTVEERLSNLGNGILKHLLAGDSVDFIRLAITEARRFPDLAKVGGMMRERGAQHAAAVFKEVALSKQGRAYPAFAPKRLMKTTYFFLDLVVAPLLMRAAFGEDLKSVRGQIRSHVAESVSFFLTACRSAETER
ncbi:TetR/AcrR family transcriptional regulator [Bradyrhizobium genosp. P]|uniref:TetR/AcrR family transcriptional regulator n=1 Tax=Bradyrhizobium genosp. P TaxID=83641 RepID=UPI003CF3D72F